MRKILFAALFTALAVIVTFVAAYSATPDKPMLELIDKGSGVYDLVLNEDTPSITDFPDRHQRHCHGRLRRDNAKRQLDDTRRREVHHFGAHNMGNGQSYKRRRGLPRRKDSDDQYVDTA